MKYSNKLDILYEDAYTLVINKGIGMPVQTLSPSDLSIENLLKDKGLEYHIITRLDQPVSGLCLIAKTKKAAAFYSSRLRSNEIKKEYHVIVEGHLPKDEDTLIHHLIKKGSKSFVDALGKASELSYKTIQKLDRYTIISALLQTGRFHQIRAQLSHIGHPIKGDLKYGARRSNKEGGLYLHSATMELELYKSDHGSLSINAPYPSMPLWQLNNNA